MSAYRLLPCPETEGKGGGGGQESRNSEGETVVAVRAHQCDRVFLLLLLHLHTMNIIDALSGLRQRNIIVR